jgi:ABC-type transport system involved in multi-copper enzyme maturation permease subunit
MDDAPGPLPARAVMLGPVLRQELRAGSRNVWLPAFRCGCAVWLACQLVIFLEPARVPHPAGPNVNSLLSPIPADALLYALVAQQLVLIVLLTPALAAGALTGERARGTLELLLTTALTPAQIVRDKWLGRTSVAGAPVLLGLPLLAYLAGEADVGPLTVLGLTFLWLGPLLALAAAGVLASTLCRTTTEALLLVYGGGLALLLAVRWLGGPLSYLDPTRALEPLQPPLLLLIDNSLSMGGISSLGPPPGSPVPDLAEFNARLLGAAIAWGSVTLACLALATWRLRPAYRRQLEAGARGRRLTAEARPSVGDDPVRWKARYIDGVTSLPVFRRVPRRASAGVLLALAVLLLTGVALWCHTPEGVLRNGRVIPVNPALVRSRAESAFPALARAVALFASVIVGVRCSAAIRGEQSRQTWEPLLLTSLTAGEIVDGTFHGVRDAVRPLAVAFAVLTLLFALPHGVAAGLWTACALVGGWLLMSFMAAMGVYQSAVRRTALARLLGTLFGGYLTFFAVLAVACGVCVILEFLLLNLLSFLLPSATDFFISQGGARAFLVGTLAVSAFVLRRFTDDLLDAAERVLGASSPQVVRH